jgi:hypothetical protein
MTSIRPRPLIHSVAATILTFFLLVVVTRAAEVETVALFNPLAFETPESVQFDRHGNAYISMALTGEIRKIAPGGVLEVVLEGADRLDGPTAAAFGVGADNKNLYITNAAFPFFPGPDPRRPSLLRLHVGIPGQPRT